MHAHPKPSFSSFTFAIGACRFSVAEIICDIRERRSRLPKSIGTVNIFRPSTINGTDELPYMRSRAAKSRVLGRLGNLCANLGESPDARVTLILGDTVNPTAIINCLVNYIPSRDGAHMLVETLAAVADPPSALHAVPLLPTSAESRAWPDRNELFNYHDLSPGVSFQSIMHDRSWHGFPTSTLCFLRASESMCMCASMRVRYGRLVVREDVIDVACDVREKDLTGATLTP